MGAGASGCKSIDLVSEAEIQAAVKAITDWEDAQKAGQKAAQALRTVRKDSFKKAAKDLDHAGSVVERIGGPDRVHDVIQAFYRKLFAQPEVRHFFEVLSPDRMRAKQMKFMRYLFGGPGTYVGNLRCVHAQMVKERGLDVEKFGLVVQLLLDTLAELKVPQDVVDDVVSNVEAAKSAIFTPNPDELVSKDEMVAALEELRNPLIVRLGGPEAVQVIVAEFYKRLFGSEELKYFFVNMTTERLRNMQFKFMRYLFCGPSSYALTGGNMRCVHARLVKENGLDLPKFNKVVQMLAEVLDLQMVSKINTREVMSNVEAAKSAIFTPGPDELVTREEMVAEVESLDCELVARMGGPEAVYELIRVFYSRLFNDEQLKYFFTLTTERLRTKQFRFMRYLVAGPEAYAAMGGNLRCKHLALIRDKGLNLEKFDRVVGILKEVVAEVGVPADTVPVLLEHVEAARRGIFTPGPEELVSRDELMAAAAALNSDLVDRVGGPAKVHNVVSSFYAKLFHDEELKYHFVSLSDDRLRTKQFKLMGYLFGGPEQYAAKGGDLHCVHVRMVAEQGLTPMAFDRVAGMMAQTLEEEEAPADVIADICKNVAMAKKAIFGDVVSSSRPASAAVRGDQSLFARLGGEAGVGAVVDALHERVKGDAQLAHVLAGVDMAAQRKQQLAFLRQVLTAPAPAPAAGSRPPSSASSPFSISAAHLTRDKGLTPVHFEAITKHLLAVLSAQGVPAPVAAELQALLGPGRCMLCPAGPATGCPFAAMMGGGDDPLDAIITSAASAAQREVAKQTSTKSAASATAAAPTPASRTGSQRAPAAGASRTSSEAPRPRVTASLGDEDEQLLDHIMDGMPRTTAVLA